MIRDEVRELGLFELLPLSSTCFLTYCSLITKCRFGTNINAILALQNELRVRFDLRTDMVKWIEMDVMDINVKT